MVALQQPYYGRPAEPPAVMAARAELDRLQTGLPRALLAAPTEVIRDLAGRALHAQAVVSRRRALLGAKPALDDAAEAAVLAAAAACEQASAARARTRSRGHVLLAQANVVALGCLGLAGSLHLSGLHPMATPVVAAVVGAAGAPLAAVAVGARRRASAGAAMAAARRSWASALDGAGVPTMGALAARRLAVSAWELRRRELEVAEQAAARHLRAWQRMAGPGARPEDVESLLARLAALRVAQLRLLAALVQARARAAPPAPPVLLATAEPEVEADRQPAPRVAPEPEPARSRIDEAMERLGAGRLHLWFWR